MMIDHLKVFTGEFTEIRIVPCPTAGDDDVRFAFHMERGAFALEAVGTIEIRCCRCNMPARQFMDIVNRAIGANKTAVEGCPGHTEHKWTVR